MNLNCISASICVLTALGTLFSVPALGQTEPWWKGIFKPKSESVNVYSPAVPADTISVAPETDQMTNGEPFDEGVSTKDENFLETIRRAVESPSNDAETTAEEPSVFSQEPLPPGHFRLDQPARLDTLDSLWRLSPCRCSGSPLVWCLF